MTTKGRTMADGCAGLDVVNDELMWLMWDIVAATRERTEDITDDRH